MYVNRGPKAQTNAVVRCIVAKLVNDYSSLFSLGIERDSIIDVETESCERNYRTIAESLRLRDSVTGFPGVIRVQVVSGVCETF